MGLFKKIFKPKSPDSKRFRREMAEQMCGHHIRYVTEKRNGVDEVIGRNGGLNIRDDELLVFASADVIFRCKIDDMQAWELLSRMAWSSPPLTLSTAAWREPSSYFTYTIVK